MTHQPRVAGMGGYIGIDFNLFRPYCEVYDVPQSEQRILLDKILILNKVAVAFAQQEEKSRQEMDELKSRSQSRR